MLLDIARNDGVTVLISSQFLFQHPCGVDIRQGVCSENRDRTIDVPHGPVNSRDIVTAMMLELCMPVFSLGL
jgi:hypothetical protein